MRRPDVQWKPAPVGERQTHAQSVPCELWLVATRQPCPGRVSCLTHDILGTYQRCNRCGAKQRVTGRMPLDSHARPRQGQTPERNKGGRPRKPRVCTAQRVTGCTAEPPVGRMTCSDACLREVSAAGGRKGGGIQKRRAATQLEVRL